MKSEPRPREVMIGDVLHAGERMSNLAAAAVLGIMERNEGWDWRGETTDLRIVELAGRLEILRKLAQGRYTGAQRNLAREYADFLGSALILGDEIGILS